MIRIVKAVHTCYALPSTWDAWTEQGEYLHLKYRRGLASVWVGPEDEGPLEMESALRIGHRLDGFTTLEEFCEAMGLELALEEPYVPLPDPNGGFGVHNGPLGMWTATVRGSIL
ncbi:hypothetical protein [Nocardia asiatica]